LDADLHKRGRTRIFCSDDCRKRSHDDRKLMDAALGMPLKKIMAYGPRQPSQAALDEDLLNLMVQKKVIEVLAKIAENAGLKPKEAAKLLIEHAGESVLKPPAPTLSVIENPDHSEQLAKKTPPLRVVKSDGGAA
jgi:hypothetical protein